MITSYCVLRPEQAPHGSKQWLEDELTDNGVTGFNVTLLSASTVGYVFSIEADENTTNESILTFLFGNINTIIPGADAAPLVNGESSPQAAARGMAMAAPERTPWAVAGSEGRFAAENPPPPWAK